MLYVKAITGPWRNAANNQKKEVLPKPPPPEKQHAIILPLHSPNRSLDFLVELIDKFRPDIARDSEQAELRFKTLLYHLSKDKTTLFIIPLALY